MPSRTVWDAVHARLAANWTETPIIPYDTVPEPPDINAFMVVQFPVINESKPVLGEVWFEEGAIRLVLNVRRGIGPEQALTWTDELKLLFRDLKFDGVQTFTPSGPVIDDNNEEGDWVSYSIVIPYRYEFAAQIIVEAAGAAGGMGL